MIVKNIGDRRWIEGGAVCEDEDVIWISTMEFNALYCYDKRNDVTEYIARFPYEKNNVWKLHGIAMKNKNEIFFLPDRSQYVHIYNISTKEMDAIKVEAKGRRSCNKARIVDQKLYFLFEDDTYTMYTLDLQNRTVEKMVSMGEWIGELCSDYIFVDNKFYFACKDRDTIISYEITKNEVYEYNLKADGVGFGTIVYIGESFYMTGIKQLFRWSPESGIMNRYEIFPDGFGMVIRSGGKRKELNGFVMGLLKNEKPFSFSAIIKNKIWLFPFRTNRIVMFDIVSGKVECYILEGEEEDDKSLARENRLAFCHYLKNQNHGRLVFSSTKSKKTYVFQAAEDSIKISEYRFWADKPRNIPYYIFGEDIRKEELDGSIQEFLESIR